MPDGHAVLLEQDGRSVLRFQRALDHPRERVWRALTERDELAAWHPTPFRFEPRAGAAIEFEAPPGMDAWPRGRVLACEEPSLLAYTWGPPPEDELRWTIEERGGGCLLTLEHHFADRFKAARDGAGWHLCLRALDARLDGAAVPEQGSAQRLPAGWSELNEDYQRRFGIAPGEATPVPRAGD
jgi:uncharacterized protein YndB with AHSA1/START domain